MADLTTECTPFNADSNRQGNSPMNHPVTITVTPGKRSSRTLLQKFFSGPELLTTLTVISTFLGIMVGLLLRSIFEEKRWTVRERMYIQFLGDIFLRMLKMLIIPLLTCSIISAIGSLDLSLSKKIGTQSILYYVATTTFAVFQGIFWVLIVRPGKFAKDSSPAKTNVGETRNITTTDTLLDLVRNLVPSNIVEACVLQDKTTLTFNATKSNFTDKSTWDINFDTTRGTNVLGLVAFSIALGIACARLGPKARAFIDVIDSLGEAIMLMTKGVIWFSPVGVFFLVITNMLEMESFGVLMGQLGLYFITVLVGLMVHGFITVPSLYLLCLRKFPFKFIKNMSPAIVTAFGTASSSASLPVSMHCLEGANKIDQRVSRFVMPIGATINMDGTALYEAVAAIYISQLHNMELSLGEIMAVSITATMASIGAAGIPQAGLVTMVMVLDTVGLPAESIGYILAVDWLLDRFRTVVNVLGDAIGAGIVAKFARNELRKLDEDAKAKANNYTEATQNDSWNMTQM